MSMKRVTGLATQVVRVNKNLIVNKYFHIQPTIKQQTASASTEQAAVDPELLSAKPYSEVPGPRSYPIVKSLPSMIFDKDFDNKRPQNYWTKMAAKYGSIIKVGLPGYPDMVMLTDPDDAEKVVKSTMDNPVRHALFSLAKIRKEAVDNYFESKGGLLIENEEEWKRVRSRVQTPMMKPKNVTAYLTKMDQVTLDFIKRISILKKQHGEMPSDFQMELYKWALESVSLVALNRRMGCLDPNLSSDSESLKLINTVQDMLGAISENEVGSQLWRIYPTKSFKKLQTSHAEFLRIADHHIRQTEAQLLSKRKKEDQISENEDLTLMETLLLTEGLSRKDVVTLILDMLFAGIDTTAHCLGFTLYLLARNPDIQAKLHGELDNVLGDHQGPLNAKHLAQLSYLKAVVKESLRLFPLTMGFVRNLQSDIVLSGYLVPKGCAAASLNMFIGKDEKYFPKANEFLPDRWLRHRPLGPIHPYASLPFSVGTRMCIGRRIAEQEIYTFLARVLHRYSVDYKYEDMDSIFRLVFTPSQPLRFTFNERQ